MLLAFDTATDTAGVAVYDAAGLRAEANWFAGRGHSSQLLPMAQQLLSNLDLTPAELTGVAVSVGPGSWSGIRVGMSSAKGLALAHDLPLLGISSLETLAYPHQRIGRSVIAVIKLGRDRYAMAEYRLRRAWTRIGVERNVSREELLAAIPELALVCGDVDPRLALSINKARGAGVVIPSPAVGLRRAGFLAEIAWNRLQAGERDDLTSLEPSYLGAAVKEPAK
ncbi:tRNA (adenosine(37)-N6)-threonylcarbamoyltransferase complex dimerization subunit type 1 TsaB [Herpetosiphon gulosus]|uniref:tRNA threonylcarbamoyladenosine biosynthesis protein TsaB n=1 Tax=Herpetosiphon gulosus TaxID=1973496 RepID=A0ABP9WV86_9CHLR